MVKPRGPRRTSRKDTTGRFKFDDSELAAVLKAELVLTEDRTKTRGASEGVGSVQDALMHLGYLRKIGATRGFFGPVTVKALKRFQENQILEVNGDIDQATLVALRTAVAKKEPRSRTKAT